MHLNTQFVLNALLECIKFLLYIVRILTYLISNWLFINRMFAFLLQELDLLQYS